jgi:hypothetical protein
VWTSNQLAHEVGTLAAFLIAIVCLGYFAYKWASVFRNRDRDLRDQGIVTGLIHTETRALKNRRRFSLLDMLVIITLIAALAGLVNGLMNEGKHGMRFRYVPIWWSESNQKKDSRESNK